MCDGAPRRVAAWLAMLPGLRFGPIRAGGWRPLVRATLLALTFVVAVAPPGRSPSPDPPAALAPPGRSPSPDPPAALAPPGRSPSPDPPAALAPPGRSPSPDPPAALAPFPSPPAFAPVDQTGTASGTGTTLPVRATLDAGGTPTPGLPSPAGTGRDSTCPPAAPGTAADPNPVPWALLRYSPDRLAGLADGRGVLVAVIDSGVDARHPALRDRVLPGVDLLDGGDGRMDCVGHGTAVASIIAGTAQDGLGFRGLAPGARILPLRVSEQRTVASGEAGRSGTPAGLAAAIRIAVDRGALVINMSVVLYRDDPQVRTAIGYALAHDVVLVAAAGNAHDRGDPPPYPAAYPGVLGVGAIGPDGLRLPESQVGRYVQLVAPGGQIVAAAVGRRYASWDGTSLAAPFVSAAAALVRQYRPDLPAADVVRRLIATADPAPGGPADPGYGHGVLNPYRAVTETLSAGAAERPGPLPGVQAGRPGATTAGEIRGRAAAVEFAAVGGVLVMLLAVAAAVIPHGRRRRWRPGAP
jgi:membrane-anchored mycosin MYCP